MMKKWLLALALSAPLLAHAELIEDQYIVTLHVPLVENLDSDIASLLATLPGAELLARYRTVLTGFSARMSPAQAELLSLNPLVRAIEQDRLVRATATQTNATWGLDRVDQRAMPLDQTFAYPDGAGGGVHVYVIDSGINPEHQEFAGRIGESRNFSGSALVLGGGDPEAWQDCNGHGTHVASTAVGTTWGVAKQAVVHAVRVLDCLGSGSGTSVLSGMEWVANNAIQPAVANLSLATVSGRSQAQEDAVRAMFESGTLPIVAAGNDSADACNTSPAAEPSAVTVAASDSNDAQSSFSNHGVCVDTYAPGSDILAADYNSNTAASSKSGTSMASPHVAGVAAVLLSQQPDLDPTALTQALLEGATVGAISNPSVGTPNRLVYLDPNSASVPPVDFAPNAVFTVTCNSVTCSFDASGSSDDSGIASYAWDFGDGQSGVGETTAHTYATGDTYSVTLTVTDTAGQTDSVSQDVNAGQSCGLFGCGGGLFGGGSGGLLGL